LNITNELPFGAGLGASASVCVLITNLLFELKILSEQDRFQFARQLEGLFHGESSGVDIAVTLINRPIRFNREKGYEILSLQYKPQLTLHYTGKRGITRECIEVVKNVISKNPQLGTMLDEQMALAVQNCEKALISQDEEKLGEAIKLACQVYQSWGLIDPLSDELMKKLIGAGAIAVKPTGSGLGGFVLALWPGDSEAYLRYDGIPAFSSGETIG
jgi:mevalonate kinase